MATVTSILASSGYGPPTLGTFLDFDTWVDAIRLLDYQINRTKRNKHYNSLSMAIYERLGIHVRQLATQDYFDTKIASNLLYALQQEFSVLPYVIPRSGLD